MPAHGALHVAGARGRSADRADAGARGFRSRRIPDGARGPHPHPLLRPDPLLTSTCSTSRRSPHPRGGYLSPPPRPPRPPSHHCIASAIWTPSRPHLLVESTRSSHECIGALACHCPSLPRPELRGFGWFASGGSREVQHWWSGAGCRRFVGFSSQGLWIGGVLKGSRETVVSGPIVPNCNFRESLLLQISFLLVHLGISL